MIEGCNGFTDGSVAIVNSAAGLGTEKWRLGVQIKSSNISETWRDSTKITIEAT